MLWWDGDTEAEQHKDSKLQNHKSPNRTNVKIHNPVTCKKRSKLRRDKQTQRTRRSKSSAEEGWKHEPTAIFQEVNKNP